MVAKVFFLGDGLKDGCFLELLDAFSINVIPWMNYRLGSFLCSNSHHELVYIYISRGSKSILKIVEFVTSKSAFPVFI